MFDVEDLWLTQLVIDTKYKIIKATVLNVILTHILIVLGISFIHCNLVLCTFFLTGITPYDSVPVGSQCAFLLENFTVREGNISYHQ